MTPSKRVLVSLFSLLILSSLLLSTLTEFSLPSLVFPVQSAFNLTHIHFAASQPISNFSPPPSPPPIPEPTPAVSCKDPYRRPGFLLRGPEILPKPRLKIDIRSTNPFATSRWIPLDALAELPPLPAAKYTPSPNDSDAKAYDDFFVDPSDFIDPLMIERSPISWTDLLRIALALKLDFSAPINSSSSFSPPPSYVFTSFFRRHHNLTEPLRADLVRSLSWLRDRRILILGDSVDRKSVASFCAFLNLQPVQYGGLGLPSEHTTAYCYLPELNFAIVQWHLPGLGTMKPKWWFQGGMDYIAFEDRFEHIFLPYSYHEALFNRTPPDLVLFQSALWDERAFSEAAHYYKQHPNVNVFYRTKNWWKTPQSQLTFPHLRFLHTRLAALVEKIRETFGADVPLMYRAPIPRGTNETHREDDLGILSIDRMARALAEREGIEVFEWGKIVYGYQSEYFDELHPHVGGGISWLFCDMVLSYLFRVAGGVVVDGEVVRWPPESEERSEERNGGWWAECHEGFIEAVNR